MKTVREEARDIPVKDEYDVLVCGGGIAGVAAAIAAAKMGAKTALIEAHGFLGGVNTAAGVNGIGGWQFDLDGRPLISGVPFEMMRELLALEGTEKELIDEYFSPRAAAPDYRAPGLGCYWIRTNPQLMKIALDNLVERYGIHLFLHASAVAPIVEGARVLGAFMESKSGRQSLLAKVTIDATGDGDIAARAGAEFRIGREEDGLCQPMSMIFTVGNGKRPYLNYDQTKDESDIDPMVRNRYAASVALARARGEIVHNPNDILCSMTPLNEVKPDLLSVNFTRVQRLLPTDVDQYTRAEVLGRKQVIEGLKFLRKYVAGNEGAYLANIPCNIGVRESRRIIGDYVLTGADVRGSARFADSICRGIYLLDIHNPAEVGKPSELILLDAPYDIPYRCLLPAGLEGILTTGRCISGDAIALASYRIMSHGMALGEAAGTAGALAADAGRGPRGIDPARLRQVLTKNGANVGSGL